MISKLHFGLSIEKEAESWFLKNFEATTFARNYRCRVGEIDLIFEETRKEKRELVFVEVRARLSGSWESALESVSFKKRLRLRRTIQKFLVDYRGDAQGIRFDILAWDGKAWLHAPQIEL